MNKDAHTSSVEPTISVSSSTATSSPSSSVPHYSVQAVGILTSDVVLNCAYYPSEDESIRASSRQIRPGGNATNSLRVFSQLAASPVPQRRMTVSTSLLSSLGSAQSTAACVRCVHSYGIDTSHCPSYEAHTLPTSYIVNAQRTGSRTIVHYRGALPELSAAHFTPLVANSYTMYHFEGRSNTTDLHAMLSTLTQRQQQQQQQQQQQHSPARSHFLHWPLISLEVEKPRDNIHQLFPYPNLLILSHDYALTLHPTATSPTHFLTTLPILPHGSLLPQPGHQLIVVCWGAQGSGVRWSDGRVCASGAERVVEVVDSVGAGDSFIAALLYGVLGLREQLMAAGTAAAGVQDGVVEDMRLVERLLKFANAVAAAKCRVSGMDLAKPVVEQLLTGLYTTR